MTATVFPETLDVSQTPAVPFSRLVRVELRKLFDTRAGRWLLISIALVTLVVLAIQLAVVLGQSVDAKYTDFMQGANAPMAILLPVLGIMSVTSEWSQRTGMVTFSLEPSRTRVMAAKFTSAILLSLAALAIGLVLGALANVLYGAFSGDTLIWGSIGKVVVTYFTAWVLGMATGFAFGAVFLNSAAAIVLYFVYSFVLPTIFAIGAALMNWFKDLQPWIDFNFSQQPLLDASIHGAKEWGQLVTSGVIWLVLPLLFGMWRILRAEVK